MTTDEAKLPPCPFCGGHAVECWKKKPVEQLGFSYSESSATASIACGKCGVRGRSYTVECQDRNPTDADVGKALVRARVWWCIRSHPSLLAMIAIDLFIDFHDADHETTPPAQLQKMYDLAIEAAKKARQ